MCLEYGCIRLFNARELFPGGTPWIRQDLCYYEYSYALQCRDFSALSEMTPDAIDLKFYSF